MYRAAAGQVIEVLRILHDAMDLARHIPPDTIQPVSTFPPSLSSCHRPDGGCAAHVYRARKNISAK